MDNPNYDNMTGEELANILMSSWGAEVEEYLKTHVRPGTPTTASKNSTADHPGSEELATEVPDASPSTEIEECGWGINAVVGTIGPMLQVLGESTRTNMIDTLRALVDIDSTVNKSISNTGNEVDTGEKTIKEKKLRAKMKRMIEEYKGIREENEKQFILLGIYLFYILPKQVQIMDGLKEVYSNSISGTDGSSSQHVWGVGNAEVDEYTMKIKEVNVPTIGGYPGRAFLSLDERKILTENLLRADRAREFPLFTVENVVRLLEMGPIAVEVAGFEDGEDPLADFMELLNIESNGNGNDNGSGNGSCSGSGDGDGDAMVDYEESDDDVEGELEEDYSDDEMTFLEDLEDENGAGYDDAEDKA